VQVSLYARGEERKGKRIVALHPVSLISEVIEKSCDTLFQKIVFRILTHNTSGGETPQNPQKDRHKHVWGVDEQENGDSKVRVG